jgi:hypothetical protein
MPILNIRTKTKIQNNQESEFGEYISSTTIGNICFISEDITKQISGSNLSFKTSKIFEHASLEVYINGLKMSPLFDFIEDEDLSGFSLVSLDNDVVKVLNSKSCILIKYAKVS